MPSSRSDIEAGAAFVRIYTKGMDQALREFGAFSKALTGVGLTLTGIGVAIGAPLLAAVSHFISVGSAIDDMSHRTGIGREKLSQLAFAGSLVGVKMEQVEAAVKGMIKKGFNPNDFDRIVKSINSVSDSFDRARLATHYFGKAGHDILQLIEEWDRLQARAKELGIGMTDDDVRLADQLGDSLSEVQGLLDAITAKVGAALAPVLVPILETVTDILVAVGAWADKNRELVPIIAAIAVGFVAVGSAILGILGPLAAMATIFTVVGPLIAAIFTPIGLLVVVVVALAAAIALAAATWILFTKEGQASLRQFIAGVNAIIARFEKFTSAIKTTYAALLNAVKAGDMKMAWEIAMVGMTLAFLEFKNQVIRGFGDIKDAIATAMEAEGMGMKVGTVQQKIEQALKIIPGYKTPEHGIKGEVQDPVIMALRARLEELSKQAEAAAGKKRGDPNHPDSISALSGFNPAALLRAGQLVGTTYDPALAKADTQIGLLGAIRTELTQIKAKVGPPVATR